MISTVLSILLGHQKKTLSRRELRAGVPMSPPDILYRSRPSFGAVRCQTISSDAATRFAGSTPWCPALNAGLVRQSQRPDIRTPIGVHGPLEASPADLSETDSERLQRLPNAVFQARNLDFRLRRWLHSKRI